VIVVRDEDSKKRLPHQLTHFLVMTPIEIKGLEFEDVFVYNFFTDSPQSANWNVLSATNGDNGSKKRQFDMEKDQILCSELKILYMVCTRAKNNLWFFEERPERAQSMEDYWKDRNVVLIAKNTDFLKERGSMLKPSSKSAWVIFLSFNFSSNSPIFDPFSARARIGDAREETVWSCNGLF
jgi:superfamily I DNA/RNA helicase